MQGSSGPVVRLCCFQIDDHSRLVDLLVEPDVLVAPAVVDAVYHDGQSLHPRLPARAATRVKDHRRGTMKQDLSGSRKSGSQWTLCEALALLSFRFARDSPLEGDGFEPSVPRSRSGDFRFRKVERV